MTRTVMAKPSPSTPSDVIAILQSDMAVLDEEISKMEAGWRELQKRIQALRTRRRESGCTIRVIQDVMGIPHEPVDD